MDEQIRLLAQQLLDSGIGKLSARERQVIARVVNRHTVSRNVNQAFEERRSVGDRLARSSFDPYPDLFELDPFKAGGATGSHHYDVAEPPGGQGPPGRGSRLGNNLKAELEIMDLHKKMEDMQVGQFGELLRLGQEQCRLLRLMTDGAGRRSCCATPEESGTLP